MKNLNFILLIGLLVGVGNVLGQQAQCSIKGEVYGRSSKTLLLRKCSDNYRSLYENPVKIPVKKGVFSYTFSYTEQEAYELVFEDEFKSGNWRAIRVFPINGVVECKLYPQDRWEDNKISGGELNAAYEAYLNTRRSLFESEGIRLGRIQQELRAKDEFDSPEYKEALQRMRAAKGDHDALVPIYSKMDEMIKTHTCYTEKAKLLFVDPYDSLLRAELLWKYEKIRNDPSIMSYSLIWSDVEMQMKQNVLVERLVTEVFPIFENRYPDHIYTKLIKAQVGGLQAIKVGSKYIDIVAPSVDNDTVQLSNVIQGYVSLIDMWGSWCGPCLAKTRLVVPIYEQYKSKGFKIVGIAREFKNTDAVKKRLSKEQFSWLHLVELDDRQNIWSKYGISNGSGLMVLVDKDGTILSIDPKPEELENILQQKLN